jgi:hypothetical protein
MFRDKKIVIFQRIDAVVSLLPSCVCVCGGGWLGGCTRVYPEVSVLASWRENCKWYSSLPLGAVISLFCESV